MKVLTIILFTLIIFGIGYTFLYSPNIEKKEDCFIKIDYREHIGEDIMETRIKIEEEQCTKNSVVK